MDEGLKSDVVFVFNTDEGKIPIETIRKNLNNSKAQLLFDLNAGTSDMLPWQKQMSMQGLDLERNLLERSLEKQPR